MFISDRPILSLKEDILGTWPFSKALGDAILSYDQLDSVVIALYGAWGSGKTSLINMSLEHIEKKSKVVDSKPVVMRFNPWNYSDQCELTSCFFKDLSIALRRSDWAGFAKKTGTILEAYSKCVGPIAVVPKIGLFASISSWLSNKLGKYFSNWGTSKLADLVSIKSKLSDILRKEHRKILIVIDDIDRLNNTEIRQIFQLVKSLADFPNTLYLLAFDKGVVINALAKVQEGSGEDYLKKVVQVPFEVPAISKQQIEKLLLSQLDKLIKDVPEEKWDSAYWGNIYHSCLRYFFNSIRDVKRYINSLSFSFDQVKEELNPIDFIAITAIQVFLPDVYYGIRDNKDLFAGIMDSSETRDSDQSKTRCDEVVDRAENFDKEALKELLRRLFPKLDAIYGNIFHDTHGWRKSRRICDPETFDTFFRLSLPEGEVPLTEIETILSLANNKESFEKSLLGLNQDGRIVKFLDRVGDYTETNIPKENIENVITVLMNIGDLFPEVEEGFYSLGGTPMKILRIFYQLNKRLENQQERFECLKNAIKKSQKSLYTVVNEVNALGYDHGKHTRKEPKPEEEKAVNADQLAELEKLACDKIEIWAKDGCLRKSKHLQFILFAWSEWGKSEHLKEFLDKMIQTDDGLIDFIDCFVSKVKSQAMGDYVYKTESRINLKNIKDFVNIEAIEPRLRNVFSSDEFSQMDEKRKLAVSTFLDTFDGKIKD